MTLLTEAVVDRASNGLLMALETATSGGDHFLNTGSEFIIMANVSGGSITVTFATESTVDGLIVPDLTVVIANGETRLVGPFAKGVYNDSSDFVQITYTGVTTLTIGIHSLSAVGG